MPVPAPDGYDLTDPDIYAEKVPLDEFAWLRRSAPVFWNAQTVESSSFDDGGLWVLSRHADVKAVSCAREGWSSEENTAIVRSPNPHMGFGGGGVHFCPGSHLARLEIDLMFNAIADHVPEIAPSGPQRRLRSGWLNRIKEMRVTYG